MKKIGAVFTAMICISATAVSAATSDLTPTTKGNITISGIEDAATATVYKVADVHLTESGFPKDPEYTWVGAVQTWVDTNHAAYSDVESLAAETDTQKVADFYDDLSYSIKQSEISVSATHTITGNGTISSVDMGSYLVIIEGAANVYRPSIVNVQPTYNETSDKWELKTTTLEVKSSPVTITQTADETDGSVSTTANNSYNIGDMIPYTAKASVPTYPKKATNTKYVITSDVLQNQALKTDTIKVYGVASDDSETLLTPDNQYTIDTTGTSTVKTDTVNFELVFDYAKIKSFKDIKVTYSAELLESANIGAAGNESKISLTYGNDPYVSGDLKTCFASSLALTYEIDITKKDKNTDEKLSGAVFSVKNGTRDYTFVKEADGFTYHPATSAEIADGTVTKFTTVETGANGKLVLRGVDEGSYTSTETAAPNGYALPVGDSAKTTVTLTDSNLNGSVEIENAEQNSAVVSVVILNTKGFSLPLTGGQGDTILFVSAIALFGGALTMLAVRKKKANK